MKKMATKRFILIYKYKDYLYLSIYLIIFILFFFLFLFQLGA